MVFHIHLDAANSILKHHRVHGLLVLPGVAHLSIAYEFAKIIYPFYDLNCIEDVCWMRPVVCIQDSIDFKLHIAAKNNELRFSFQNYNGQVYSEGRILHKKWPLKTPQVAHAEFQPSQVVQKQFIYDEFKKLGINYGESFRCLNNVKIRNNIGIGEIFSKSTIINFINLLDCSFQSGMAISLASNFQDLMPVSLGVLEIRDSIYGTCNHKYYALTHKINQFRTDISVTDEAENIIICVKDLGIRPGKF